MELTSEMGSSF